jgi:hypothetical protein
MNAHLSSRAGLAVGGSCVGTGLASDVQMSSKSVGSGSQLTLQDIKIDNVADDATRQVLDLPTKWIISDTRTFQHAVLLYGDQCRAI